LDYWFPRVREHLPKSPKSVLDVGGGEAPYRGILFDTTSNYTVLEIDLSRVSPQRGVDYVVGDGMTDMFLEGAFDVIVLTQVLEHVADPFRLVANCSRWLAADGTIFVSVPQYWHVHGWPSDYFRYTRYGLAEIARRSGLAVVDMWAIGGPCMLIYWAIELNFAGFMRAPLVRQLVAQPAKLFAAGADRVLFRDNELRRNPDTQGWIMIARKPAPGQAVTS
jgi:SAM-dependent methyltransferase